MVYNKNKIENISAKIIKLKLKNEFTLIDKSSTTLICAHESPISALALNQEGTLLATASEKVSIISIFNYLFYSIKKIKSFRELLSEFSIQKTVTFYKKCAEALKRQKYIALVLILHPLFWLVPPIEAQFILFQ